MAQILFYFFQVILILALLFPVYFAMNFSWIAVKEDKGLKKIIKYIGIMILYLLIINWSRKFLFYPFIKGGYAIIIMFLKYLVYCPMFSFCIVILEKSSKK